jgi:hypothetical protein
MLTILVDYNIEGQARRLWDTILTEGWPDLIPMRMVTLAVVGLNGNTTDRDLWHFAQAQQMVLTCCRKRKRRRSERCRQSGAALG